MKQQNNPKKKKKENEKYTHTKKEGRQLSKQDVGVHVGGCVWGGNRGVRCAKFNSSR